MERKSLYVIVVMGFLNLKILTGIAPFVKEISKLLQNMSMKCLITQRESLGNKEKYMCLILT